MQLLVVGFMTALVEHHRLGGLMADSNQMNSVLIDLLFRREMAGVVRSELLFLVKWSYLGSQKPMALFSDFISRGGIRVLESSWGCGLSPRLTSIHFACLLAKDGFSEG